MVNLLFFIATATASDVYELCMIKNQLWSERNQRFDTLNTTTFYTYQPVQFIIHDRYVEINREKREIEETFQKDGMNCWREHKNSFFCYDESEHQFLWEFYKRNGDVTRDVMYACMKNGNPVD